MLSNTTFLKKIWPKVTNKPAKNKNNWLKRTLISSDIAKQALVPQSHRER